MVHRRSIFFQLRWQLLIVFIVIIFVPLSIVVSFNTIRTFAHLAKQSQQFYSTLLSQTGSNLDFIYEQYARSCSVMIDLPDVAAILNAPPYKSQEEERQASKYIIGDAATKNGMHVQAAGLDGYVFLYELDRHSLLNNTDYKVHIISGTSTAPGKSEVMQSNIFKAVCSDSKIKMIIGNLYDVQPGEQQPSRGFDNEEYNPTMIYPYSHDGEENLNKFVMISLSSNFFPAIYDGMTSLNFGTLYILDRFDNILAKNHPDSNNDYYDYNTETKKYTMEKDDSPEAMYGMTFRDYDNLLTDERVLLTPTVKNILSKLTPENVERMRDTMYEKSFDPDNVLKNINYIVHNKKRYMVVVGYDDVTQCKFIYFHPMKQIYQPILNTVRVILIIAIFVFMIVILIALVLSKKFTDPISNLSDAAAKIADGNYNIVLNDRSSDEIMILQDSFSQMAVKIKNYTENLEKMVSDRTAELKTAHDQLAKAHKALWGEMELAKKLQISLLPKTSMPNYDVAARMTTADEVGGDFYDFLNYGGKNAVMIGDVSGHGVTPGLITMIAQSIIYSLTTQNGDIKPEQLFTYLNQLLMRSIHNLGINIFVTMSLLQEVEDGVFRGVGKHNDILVYRAKTDTVDVIPTEGVWLCMVDDVSGFIKEYEVSLDKGDIMMLYTDGLSEGANADNECFDAKLCDLLKKYADQPAETILNNIMNDYVEFIETQDDDVTLLVIKK